jgi:DNA-binding transcriptional LysR family regulator
MNILIMMETFAAVVEAGSFTAAAEQLGLSKSFVSKRISLLEAELGTRLLYRTTRKLSLSDEGSQFYDHCKLIMVEAENAKAEVIESQSNPQGKIRITLPQSLVISVVGDVLLRFKQLYPDIELDIIASGRVEDLVEKSIDLALRVGHLQDSSLKSRRLTGCGFQVVASPCYIEKFGQPLHPEELINHNCLIYSDSKVGNRWPFFQANGETIAVNVSGNLTSTDGHFIVKAALGGVGIGFGPDFLYKKYIETGALKLLMPSYYSEKAGVFALYPLNQNPSRRVRLLIDYLAEQLQDND